MDTETEAALGRMTLVERDAFERGKRHAVRTLAAATKKVLDAASLDQLIAVMSQDSGRLRVEEPDPTKPATWSADRIEVSMGQLVDPTKIEVQHTPAKTWMNDDPTEPAAWEQTTPARRILGRSPVADVKDHLGRFESAPGVARDEAHRDFVHEALAMPKDATRDFTLEHLARPGEMALAAACYAERAFGQIRGDGTEGPPRRWPFHFNTWRDETPIKNLEKAARLLACEIEQMRHLAALPDCPACRHQPHLPGQCMNMASDGGCDCRQPETWGGCWVKPATGQVGTRPGDEDRHTVGEHR